MLVGRVRAAQRPTQAATRGYATAYGCDDGRPATSNINFAPGANVANLAAVEPDADGDVCVYLHRSAHLVVDAVGHTGSGYDAIGPRRLADSRR